MNTKKSFMSTLAIMSAYVYGTGMMVVNPIIQKLIEAYPEISIPTIKMVSTLPSLISAFVMVLIGRVVGRKLKYKTVLIFSMICFFIGGMLPIVLNSSFYYILAARAIFGLGMSGISIRNALVIASYDLTDRAKYLGFGVFVANGCGVLMQIICGSLADISLEYSHLVYLVTIIPLVLIVGWLKEPESSMSTVNESSVPKEKAVIKPRVWGYIIIGLVWCILGYSIMTNMSTFIKMKNLGEASISGAILSLYTLGGAKISKKEAETLKWAANFAGPVVGTLAVAGCCIMNAVVPAAIAVAMKLLTPKEAAAEAEKAAYISAGVPGTKANALKASTMALNIIENMQ